MSTYKINGVEIFAIGKWNGDEYTQEDLEEMVLAFNETKDTIRPFLKLGHSGKQDLLKKEGMPAAGWVDRVYIKGEKLVADFTDIPKAIYQLINKKAYRKVSSEIFINLKFSENKTYKKMLAAVALLGAETPGVYNLKDILAQYTTEHEALKVYDLDLAISPDLINQEQEFTMSKTEVEIKLELELAAKEKEAQELADKTVKFEADLKAQTDEIAELKKFKAEALKEKQELEAKAAEAQVQAFVTELQAEKLVSPAMKPLIEQLLGPEKKEYTLKVDKDEKQISKQELLKETLKLSKAISEVNFDENSSDGKKFAKDKEEDEMDKKIQAYAKENKMSYGAAAKKLKALAQKEKE